MCTALAELAASAVPGPRSAGRGVALCLLSQERLATVACQYDGDMLGVHRALQQQLGWGAQQAAAALLQGVGLESECWITDSEKAALASWMECPAQHASSLLNTTAEHIEQLAGMLR